MPPGRAAKSPLHTPLCDLLGIRHPLLLAPMAGGWTPPELVAAVSSAGGLGCFGLAGMTTGAVHDAVRRAVELTDGPVGVNVQVPPDVRRSPDDAGMHATLAPFRDELGLPPGPPTAPSADAPAALVEAALAAGARVVSTALGDPGEILELARPAGVPVLAAVTTVDEARACAAAGVDAIVAQGAEAGGHRSTFAWPQDGPPPLVGTIALVPLVVDAVDVPVVATGGIMDGRGLAAALALGAQAVQVGTRFLLAEESAAPPHYREALLALRAEDTVVTDHVSGRPARWIRNRFVDALVEGPRAARLAAPVRRDRRRARRGAPRAAARPDADAGRPGRGPRDRGRAGGRHRPPDGGRRGGDPGARVRRRPAQAGRAPEGVVAERGAGRDAARRELQQDVLGGRAVDVVVAVGADPRDLLRRQPARVGGDELLRRRGRRGARLRRAGSPRRRRRPRAAASRRPRARGRRARKTRLGAVKRSGPSVRAVLPCRMAGSSAARASARSRLVGRLDRRVVEQRDDGRRVEPVDRGRDLGGSPRRCPSAGCS